MIGGPNQTELRCLQALVTIRVAFETVAIETSEFRNDSVGCTGQHATLHFRINAI